MNLQCPSVARPNNPLGEFFERPLGELLERSTRRAFQTICLASLPNGPTGEPPEQFDQRTSQAVLCASREHRRIRMPRCDWRIRKCISQWPHNACPHRPADEPPSATLPSHHRPHDEPPSATPTTLPHFPENFAPVFHVLGKNPTHERNDHERFLEQTRRQTRKRPPQPPSASIVTHKEEPWARNTTEESEPTKGS